MEPGRLWKPGEVAALFRVDPKTVTRWAASGLLPSIRTLGGHHRFRDADVRALMREESVPEAYVTPMTAEELYESEGQ